MPGMSETSDPPLPSVLEFWEAQSPRYDADVDHGLRDPATREAWRAHLQAWLPQPPGTVLDLGCGTGSLSELALDAGHRVIGVDLSPSMVAEAAPQVRRPRRLVRRRRRGRADDRRGRGGRRAGPAPALDPARPARRAVAAGSTWSGPAAG